MAAFWWSSQSGAAVLIWMQIVESGAASSESYMLRHVRRRRRHCGGQQLKLGRWLYTGFFHWRYRHRQQRHDSAILNGSHCSRCQPHSLTSASASSADRARIMVQLRISSFAHILVRVRVRSSHHCSSWASQRHSPTVLCIYRVHCAAQ